MKLEAYTIDAANKALGRVASEAAVILRGKNSPDFKPNVAPKNKVTIINASKVKMTGDKLKAKTYKRYSGYPGGLKEVSAQAIFEKNPKQFFRHTINGMLPKNKLRREMLKNLKIEL
ncbi:MAG: 50S ribosomal protein L13 [Candidatus Tagabacteria bacterium CG09_land_8_20_14_0_10_41_14]|uniref:Large ribosomal subunit protein uL13 n=2 Tax=Candidatus Tagaibacteriota TaxID=1817918 RepID=A0A2H0WN18_9BACT|nr:MAG: 50S ribosomal protein L13 [Candidatus Tagabacteria bacterium CG09_land_8_20_14_0_10_41_14]PJE72945.1 MAG: 50S ribosomal protein L13 [Candidatus Tagabacteria bacterium CG10_big_fil_rev_8_21_14_0_10_40_13]